MPSSERDQTPSEFGGRPGLIQRKTDGHDPTPSERQTLLRQTDPSPTWKYTKPSDAGGVGFSEESYDEPAGESPEYGTRLA